MSRQSELAALARVADTGALSNRNLIINGAMQVAQRGTSFTGVQTGSYQIDRWKSLFSGVATNGIATVTQSTDAPNGFSHSYKMEVTTADTSLDPWAEYVVQQRIEGQNLAPLKKGTADAEAITVSFWVKSSTTGTYILEILDNQNSSRHINKSYTINAANTWEYKTLTFAGDTSGTITYNNTVSLELNWCLAGGSNFTGGSLQTSWGSLVQSNRKVGQLNLYATTGNYWQITGVQLEVGDTATEFEHRSYGDELARCMRYYERRNYTNVQWERVGTGFIPGTTTSNIMQSVISFSDKRTAPTVSTSAGNTFRQNGAGLGDNVATAVNASTIGRRTFSLNVEGNSRTSGYAGWISRESYSQTYIELDAEL